MWVKKSEWEEMRIFAITQSEKIKTLEKQVNALNKYHLTNIFSNNDGFVYYGETTQLCKGHIPQEPVAKTETIPCISFGELAQLIIDGKPITRKKEIEVEYG